MKYLFVVSRIFISIIHATIRVGAIGGSIAPGPGTVIGAMLGSHYRILKLFLYLRK